MWMNMFSRMLCRLDCLPETLLSSCTSLATGKARGRFCKSVNRAEEWLSRLALSTTFKVEFIPSQIESTSGEICACESKQLLLPKAKTRKTIAQAAAANACEQRS
jgi:hypothetical protein